MKNNNFIKFITLEEHEKKCNGQLYDITRQEKNSVKLLYKICSKCNSCIHIKNKKEIDLNKEYY